MDIWRNPGKLPALLYTEGRRTAYLSRLLWYPEGVWSSHAHSDPITGLAGLLRIKGLIKHPDPCRLVIINHLSNKGLLLGIKP